MTTTASNAFTTTDPGSIRRRLASILLSSEDVEIRKNWAKAVQIGTAERLLDTFVRAVEMSLYAIDRSTEERHLDTAILESSIRTILRDMDVRMMRKIPAGINVYISRSGDRSVSRTYPAFSKWTGGGRTLYNRYPIKFEAGQTIVQARLYIGEVRTDTFVSNGADFQEWLSPEAEFTVSDGREYIKGVEYSDIIVKVSGTPITVTELDQWWDMYQSTNKAVKDRTTIDGRCQLVFGDASFGYLAPPNTLVSIQYVVTKGSADNSGTFTSEISLSGSSEISAFPNSSTAGNSVETSSVSGGANEVSANTYRKTGPLLFASAGTAIRSNTAQAWAVNYPGVADALVLGQSRVNPNDRRFTNVLYACLLKGGQGISPNDYKFTSDEASGWLQAFNKRRPSVNGHVVFFEPKPSSPDLHLVLECQSYVDLALAEISATQAIQDLFKYGAGTLRGTLLLSTIFDAAKYSTEGITGVRSLTLKNDLVSYARPPVLSLEEETQDQSNIASGEYVFYVVSLCNAYNGSTRVQERSVPSNAIVYSAIGTSNPTVSFSPVVGAENYEIYCRRPGTENYVRAGVLDSKQYALKITPQTVFEDGVLMPVTQPLNFRFPKLGELKVEATYPSNEW